MLSCACPLVHATVERSVCRVTGRERASWRETPHSRHPNARRGGPELMAELGEEGQAKKDKADLALGMAGGCEMRPRLPKLRELPWQRS